MDQHQSVRSRRYDAHNYYFPTNLYVYVVHGCVDINRTIFTCTWWRIQSATMMYPWNDWYELCVWMWSLLSWILAGNGSSYMYINNTTYWIQGGQCDQAGQLHAWEIQFWTLWRYTESLEQQYWLSYNLGHLATVKSDRESKVAWGGVRHVFYYHIYRNLHMWLKNCQ